jgi:8-oxo-dGTP pyrophosphatase MutT (NUDIX family)
VALLREAAVRSAGLEAFMLRRPDTGAFAGAHVFPGSRVDSADADSRWRDCADGYEAAVIHLAGHLPEHEALARLVAGIREVFEETGILLGHGRTFPDAETRGRARQDMLSGGLRFLDWCLAQEVTIELDRLWPWAHWITPDTEHRRFDTWFFLAAAPADQQARVFAGEAVEGGWKSVSDMLTVSRGAMTLAPPTLRTLEELASHTVLDRLAVVSSTRALTPVTPRFLGGEPVPTLVLPGDPAYPSDRPAGVSGPTRFVLRDNRWMSAAARPSRAGTTAR